eukprot:scaffold119699_cov32-Tisochrysis_lutea.AAC.3
MRRLVGTSRPPLPPSGAPIVGKGSGCIDGGTERRAEPSVSRARSPPPTIIPFLPIRVVYLDARWDIRMTLTYVITRPNTHVFHRILEGLRIDGWPNSERPQGA